jgi:hypothetical protein
MVSKEYLGTVRTLLRIARSKQAIPPAAANGFIQNEPLAHEIASRFYAARSFEKIARAYLNCARYR